MGDVDQKGWMLHSLAQNKRFGPLSEEDLRMYFRAGMVKSVDRLTAPGDFAMRSAAEVATLLGEAVPAGPPPPEVEDMPTPLPSMATGVAPPDPASAERTAKALAAANIDLAALMAAKTPTKRSASWVLPVLVGGGLILMLVVTLNMARKMAPHAPPPSSPFDQVPATGSGADPALPPSADASGPRQIPGTDGAAPTGAPQDAAFESSRLQAEALKNAGNWVGLMDFAQRWSETQPERNEPLLYLATASSGLGNHQQAATALKKVLDRDPGNANAHMLLADDHLQAGRWSEAAGLYKELTVAMPGDARMWNNYGVALKGVGQPTQATAALETAVRLDPSLKQAWSNLAQLYEASGDTVRAATARANAR